MERNRNTLMLPGDAESYQCSTGDGLNLVNDTSDLMIISVTGESSGTVVRARLPSGGALEVRAGAENIRIELGEKVQRPNATMKH